MVCFNRFHVTARLAAVRVQLRHGADTRHAADELQAFAVASAIGRPLLRVEFHAGKLNTHSVYRNYVKFLRGTANV